MLSNWGQRCAFCGLNPSTSGARRILVAGHIKPWKDSAPGERLDPRNGLAACASHDVAFDVGLLTVGPALQVHVCGGPRLRSPRTSGSFRTRLGAGAASNGNGRRAIPPTAVPMGIVDGFPQVKTMV